MRPPAATRRTTPAPAPERRRTTIRYLAAAVSCTVGGLYLVLLFLVQDAESGAAETAAGNTYGAYLYLGLTYLLGAGLLIAVDRRLVWVVGAAVQLTVIVLFVMFGAGAFGPGQGVFDYDALKGLHMQFWAAGITGAEVVLLGLLSYLTFAPPRIRGASSG